jgi:hypothetical protein
MQLFIRIARATNLRCDLKMEIEPGEVMNEEADVLDLSSFPIPVTSNLDRLSKAESSAEVLILINYLKIHIKKLESAVTRTYRTNTEVPQEQAKPYQIRSSTGRISPRQII